MRSLAIGVLALGLQGCFVLVDKLGGSFAAPPSNIHDVLGSGASELVKRSLAGLDPDELIDCHVHLISHEVHPNWRSWWHPIDRMRSALFLRAGGVELSNSMEEDFLDRLVGLIRSVPGHGRYFVYAMDRHYDRDGTARPDLTSVYVSNNLVFDAAQQFDDCLIPVVSIHPYRIDALEELDRWAKRGCRYVKWIPSAMGIDPADDLVEPFYRRMLEHDMILLSHTGAERSVEAEQYQLFGNPLRLRKPLDMGLRVVALHAGSLGEEIDSESPSQDVVPSFDLFMRLMDEPQYEGLLFGEISALTLVNRESRPLRVLLNRPDLHQRLMNGSDYPLSAMNIMVHTSVFEHAGFITSDQRRDLNEIYAINPLFFDFALKRTLRDPDTGAKFSDSTFLIPVELRSASSQHGAF